MARRDEHLVRQRLKRLVGRAAQLAVRGRALSEATRRHDREAAVYLMNLARQGARLLQQVPASQVPTLRLPVGSGDARGLVQHVLRHTRVESRGSVVLRFLVLSSDGRMRVCQMSLDAPGTRLWKDYDPAQPPDDFPFEDTADALATLLDSLEQVLAIAEARLAERIARLDQRRRERPSASRSPAPPPARVPAVDTSHGDATDPSAPATSASHTRESSSAQPGDGAVETHGPPAAPDAALVRSATPVHPHAPVSDIAAAITASLPLIDDAADPAEAAAAATVHAPGGHDEVHAAATDDDASPTAAKDASADAWPRIPDDVPSRKRDFRLSRLGKTI